MKITRFVFVTMGKIVLFFFAVVFAPLVLVSIVDSKESVWLERVFLWVGGIVLQVFWVVGTLLLINSN